MMLIAPIDYERYAVLISPSAVAVYASAEASAELRVTEAIDPKLTDFSLHEGPPFNSRAELATLPPAGLPAVTSGNVIPASFGLQSQLNISSLLPEFIKGEESTPSPNTVTGLYATAQETIGKTINLKG